METLYSLISKTRRKNAVDFRYFAPSHRVREVLTIDNIRSALLHSGIEIHHVNEAIEIIKTSAWNVFAILILIKQPQNIVNFIQDDRMQRGPIDHSLPFELSKLEELLDEQVAHDFYDRQWEFTAPTFSGSVFTRVLPDDFVLPFLSDVEVVRKEFKPRRNQSEYELELRNLSILRLLKHPNIVELLGSYTYRGKHNFIFPFARCGTLADLLKTKRPSILQSNENMLLALAGLCSAVSATHNLFLEKDSLSLIGCHHDLKPQNVLVDGAVFLLADFGLSRFKSSDEGSATTPKSAVGFYVAPECEDFGASEDTDGTRIIGRSSDVWSLGCIMMEVLIYMKGGAESVKRFENERSYRVGAVTLHRFHHGLNEEEPAVVSRLENLKEDASTRPERLLANLIKQTLELNSIARPSAEEVERSMRFIAIDTISQRIRSLYAHVCQQNDSPRAFIEQVQFESWLEACDILFTHRDAQLSYRWASPSYSGYQSIIECLRELQDTLNAISLESQSITRPAYQPLERLNDILLSSLPGPLREYSRLQLEMKVLGTRKQDFLSQIPEHSYGTERQRISTLATIKQMSLLITERQHVTRQDLWIEPQRIKDRDKVGIHYIGRFVHEDERSTQVLFESIWYGPDRLEESVRLELHLRLEAMAELLQRAAAEHPQRFRVLPCIGYFHDPAMLKCGLVYSLPNLGGSNSLTVSTLRSVLTEKRTTPFLGKRFHLAQTLAAALLEFHEVAWLHKSISSLNIGFVHLNGISLRNDIDNPYLLGFSNSRPDGSDKYSNWLTENDRDLMDSQHPEYLRNEGRVRYRPEFDYYSLGMVLLEIGLWKPLNKIVANISGSPEDMIQTLRTKHVPELAVNMGVIYCDAVDACLSGNFSSYEIVEEGRESPTGVTVSFARSVVKQLGKCVV
ncbi:MAG: hypothetical protein LQ351_001882 [Letrouitia transgressa]|nr:MAG: hypothetical protein LQ351_001882 [Letrouitia transgressa]